MDKSFDPYLKWLGIRSGGRKVNHYRLLGLELFESDADVIANAAERHIKHVESFVEEHPTEAHQVIGELYAARDCLLSPEKKIQYDQRLGKKLNGNQQEQAPVIKTTNEDSPPDFAGINVTDSAPQVGNKSARPVIRPSKQRRKKKSGSFDIAGWILGAVGAIVFAYVLINTDLIDRIRGREGEVVKNEDPIEPNVNRPAEVTDKPSKPERPERNKNTNENRQPDPTRNPEGIGNLHHLAFSVSRATYSQIVVRLDERGVSHTDEVDRGFMDSIYFRDPLGQLDSGSHPANYPAQ